MYLKVVSCKREAISSNATRLATFRSAREHHVLGVGKCDLSERHSSTEFFDDLQIGDLQLFEHAVVSHSENRFFCAVRRCERGMVLVSNQSPREAAELSGLTRVYENSSQ